MAHLLRMPAVLAGSTEAILTSWRVDVGQPFAVGDALAEIETDKALVELEAEEPGTLGRMLTFDGDKVSVGDPIAVLVSDGDTDDDIAAALATAGDLAEASADAPAVGTPGPLATSAPAAAPEPGRSETTVDHARLFVSPLVRRLARERGIDPGAISGTGPNGRVVRRDLEAWVTALPESQPPATPSKTTGGIEFEDIPHSGMRRAIARRLTESKSTIPHFYLSAELRVAPLLALRATANATGDVRLTVTDLLIRAAARAYVHVPEANVIWTDDAVRRFHSVDIAVAVSTSKGLVAPVVRDVANLSLMQLSSTTADLVDRARSGRLHQHELDGGSSSISNLGMYGTREFSAILNPPQSAILAVGASRDAAVVENGAVVVTQVMNVTMAVDHRAVDGELAARWLAAFTTTVEDPVRLLL